MTPAALAAIEARRKRLAAYVVVRRDGTSREPPLITRQCAEDLAALLAHIRTMEAERETEIAAAVARERERIAQMVERHAVLNVPGWVVREAIAAAIREPKP